VLHVILNLREQLTVCFGKLIGSCYAFAVVSDSVEHVDVVVQTRCVRPNV